MSDQNPRVCEECGKPAEYPQTLARAIHQGKEYEYPFCLECLEHMADEAALEKAARRGERCWLCFQEFESPGGTTIELPEGARWLPDDPKLIRVCSDCAKKGRAP